MLPTRDEAERLLAEAGELNPGPWTDHCRTVAHCAERIAAACDGLDADKAYVLGLLHDIGRRFGYRHLGHVSDGYFYMASLGYDEVARVCLTHSFEGLSTEGYIGDFDVSDEELAMINTELAKLELDDYDLLIKLCDAMGGSDGVMDVEERMADVRRRYGSYPQGMWDANLALKARFEQWAGQDIYALVEKDTFRP